MHEHIDLNLNTEFGKELYLLSQFIHYSSDCINSKKKNTTEKVKNWKAQLHKTIY